MSVEKMALALWAKSGDPYHPLLAHMLDTAAVAHEVLFREPSQTLALHAQDWNLSPGEAVRWVALLVGLHDLGKASPVFQRGWPEGARWVQEAGLTFKEDLDWVAHGVFTELFLKRLLKERGLPGRVANDLAAALGAHHGFPANAEEKKVARRQLTGEDPLWWEARRWLVDNLLRRLQAPLPRLGSEGEVRPEAVLRVMALASFADWVASDPDFFPYGRDPLSPSYFEEAQRLAKKALDRLGWRPFRLPPRRDFASFFPFQPNPLQRSLPEALGNPKEPVLVLVEAPMGTGKTEAALYAHHLLQQALHHRGLYVGLPTQATANGLFPRVQAFLEKTLEKPEIQLQHGTALLNPRYAQLLERANPTQVGDEGEEGGAVASAWFSARKRAMLAPNGVGTLDQALLGVLRVKHHFVRLWGLMNRVVVLDEVHAYDVYTSELLGTLLRWLKALGSSAIVMTATLPPSRRRKLLQAWAEGEVAQDLGAYPRVAVVEGGGIRYRSLPQAQEVEVALKRVSVGVEELAKTLKEALPGAIGALVNTVDRAQGLYTALGAGRQLTLGELEQRLGRALEGELLERNGVVGKVLADGTLVFLLHARFPAEERALREGVVLNLFGKGGPRPERAILVATQVAEQSLDLDFDLLYTDLAPIDLLFQRAGRLHRHKRERPEGHMSPRLLLGVPAGLHFGKPLYWDAVYEEFVLLSTWRALQGRASLRLPQDLEALLEEVYEKEDPGRFPMDLQERARRSLKRLQEHREKEAQTAKSLSLSDLGHLLAYWDVGNLVARERLEDDEEKAETQRLLTRLGDPSVAVVPLFRVGEGLYLDRKGHRRAPLKGQVSPEEAEALFRRAVRLSRYPLPQTLLQEEPPAPWRKSGLLRGLRPLEVGRVFGGAFRIELDPELGVVYRPL
ncbi:CRISPR-associated helicase Cas3' [Thermus scotoductus]|uniref:CRISPR-associated helicase/endonuclease Cas3 n=3 Tax=Thermus scotoductus TaxID=37636 RepID=A0A430UQP6_THESC|nr:CRISPR-associated helicase Cas3' [Thermus scotoductus]RTI08240.1 CRISPR-associated helicase/endonuclease Cas3 [Thermus scotoductus]RTI10391.1 CRISPR-associated helicase/endonuclease Cas3 [Thermus scotoductus]RTI12146.1 CRISPR-associated helicase/endonuclease Cas3 [Thermus scotoductus]